MKHAFATLLENARQNTDELSVHISKYDENLGELVLLLDINEAGEDTKKIVKHIIEDSEYHYFHSVAAEPEKALEDALQKINLGISETLKHTKKDWLPHSSLLIAACLKGEVHFARVGQMSAFLISKENGAPEIIQITDTASGENVNPMKVFSNIYSGQLPKDAAMLFVSDGVLDYVSQEKLRKISGDNSLKQAMAELKILLKKAPETKKFGAVISKTTEDDAKQTEEARAIITDKAVIKPVGAESKEERKISPKQEQKEKIKTTTRQYEKPVLQGESEWGKSPMNKKIVLYAGVLLIILIVVISGIKFFGKSGSLKPSPDEETAPPTFEEIAAAVQAKFVEAQNLLILDKNAEAKTVLEQTRAQIAGLREDTPEHAAQKRLFSKKVETQILLAEGVGLTVPTLLGELTGISGDELVRKGDTLFLIDSQSGSIYQISSAASAEPAKLEITTSGEIGPLEKTIDEAGESIIFYHGLGGLAELNVSKKTMKELEWNRASKEAPIASDIYQNKLYVVAPGNAIFKYTRAITGFTQETSWIKEGATISLEGTADMAIDGTVWILKNNGEILKLFKGAREPFAFTISPSLKTPVKLFTDLNLKNLYILDAGTNRIVILGKDGKVISQFTAEQFSRVKDFAVDEVGKKIYVLDEDAIFVVKF